MPISSEKIIERSVDSLQKIYAVIVALAISLSIQNLLINKTDNSFTLSLKILDSLPAFLSFVAVLVPFYHGMNRHLDKCYIEGKKQDTVQGALLFDFIVFFFEASILFAVAASITSGLQSFLLLGSLLFADMIWALVSHWIHYKKFSPSVVRWAGINFVTLILALFVFLTDIYSATPKAWLLFALAVARGVADYWFCWAFYFPQETNNN
jgi:hypothetical protein